MAVNRREYRSHTKNNRAVFWINSSIWPMYVPVCVSVVGISADTSKPGTKALKPKVMYGSVQMREFVSQPVTAAFFAGGVAGAVSRTVVSPLERLKILYQIQSAGRAEYSQSVGKSLARIWHEEGWRGFMRGNGTNCVRIVPYSAVQFGSYNFYKPVRCQ